MKRSENRITLFVALAPILFIALVLLLCLVGCSTIKEVPVNTVEKVVVRDTTIYVKDTIKVEVPKQVVKEVIPQLDTSILSTSVAESIAYLDTTKRSIYHKLTQKGHIPIIYDTLVKVQYVDKYINKEIPIEVVKEVKYIPEWCWYSLIANIVFILLIAFRIYLRFKRVV